MPSCSSNAASLKVAGRRPVDGRRGGRSHAARVAWGWATGRWGKPKTRRPRPLSIAPRHADRGEKMAPASRWPMLLAGRRMSLRPSAALCGQAGSWHAGRGRTRTRLQRCPRPAVAKLTRRLRVGEYPRCKPRPAPARVAQCSKVLQPHLSLDSRIVSWRSWSYWASMRGSAHTPSRPVSSQESFRFLDLPNVSPILAAHHAGKALKLPDRSIPDLLQEIFAHGGGWVNMARPTCAIREGIAWKEAEALCALPLVALS